MKNSAAEVLRCADGRQATTLDDLATIFEPGALASLRTAFDGDCQSLLKWWRSRVAPGFQNRIQFPAAIAATLGPRALLEDPRVIVGTIHSVKGGEADVVYLFPDLSQAGDAQYRVAGSPRDSVIRVFYVGATRARETLYICQRETGMAIAI